MQSRKFLYFIRLMLASILFSMLPTAQAIPAVAATPMHSNAAVRPRLSTPSPTFTQPTYQQQATPPDFPASTVLDSFDRADGAPGQNWAGVSTGYHIQNNALVAQSGGALYWATSFTSQQEVWTTITNPDAGANEIDLLLKGQGTGGCDVIELLYSPSNHTIQVWTCANESWEQQGATLNATLQAGDRLGARFVDGSIEVYQNSTLIGTIAIPNSWPFANQGGHIGLWIDNPNGLILDDFGGGSLSTTPPPSTGTLQVTGTPASGSITVSAEGRFTLVFDQDHKWQAGAWYDLQSDPSLNLARSDGPTLNYNVIQSPLELYYQGWNNLETATNPTIEIVSQNTEQVVLQTGWQWQTADGSSFMVAATHTINRNGQWQIQSSLTNTSSSSRSIQDRGIEYAFTNVRPQQEWLASTASDQSSFDLTRSDGPTPHPHFVAHRGDTGGLLNTVSTDGDLNRYWTLGNIILESGASWQTSWSNEIWRGGSNSPLVNASLRLTPVVVTPLITGSTQTLTATLRNAIGEPLPNWPISVTITGVHTVTMQLTTQADGIITFSYQGNLNGVDQISAIVHDDLIQIPSNIVLINWITPVKPIATTAVLGRFFPTKRWDYLVAKPGDVPALSMMFPSINFNPPTGSQLILGDTSGVNPSTKPFTHVATDAYGNYTGILRAESSTYQAGVMAPADMTFFNAVFTAAFVVKEAGRITLRFWSDDAFMLGVGPNDQGQQPTRVSGIYKLNLHGLQNPGLTPFEGYPVLGGTNTDQAPAPFEVTIDFPAPGTYPYELDFAQVNYDRMTLTMSVQSANGTIKAMPSSGALVLTPPTPNTLQVGASYTATITARDASDLPLANVPIQILVTGVHPHQETVVTNSAGQAILTYTGAHLGKDTVTATAYVAGTALLSNMGEVTWTPGAVAASPAPLVTPGWLALPSLATISNPKPIALASDITLTTGTLSYWPAENPQAITTLATNLSATGGSTLATFDPTLLANGSYVIQLEGTNSLGETKASGIMVTVAGDYKPGRVRFSVTDLTIPLVGMPITIGRTYDSLERNQSSDFGYGWSLDIGNPRLTVDPAHNVTVTQPNGQRVTFYFAPRSYGGVFGALQQPAYLPEPGVYGSLTANGCAIVVQSGGWHCFLDTASYQPTTYTYTDPYGRVFVMGADGKLQSITDLNQNRLTFTPQGITSSAGGMHVSFQRDAQGRMTSISDPAGNQYGYGYDAAGDLRSVTLPGVTTPLGYSYETQWPHLIHAIQDARGYQAASASYYPDGRLQAETTAVGDTTRYAYNLSTRTTTTTNPDLGVETRVYDAYGKLLQETDALNHTTVFTYDATHQLLTRRNALNQLTSYSYDAKGNQTSVTNGALGTTSTTTYTQYGGPTTITSMIGITQTISYDAAFMPQAIQDAQGTRASFRFDSHGSMLSATNGAGETTTFTYDASGNQLSSTDALQHATTFRYDTLGRMLTRTDALNHQTEYAYTALGHTAVITDADGFVTSFGYDANGNKIWEQNARNQVTTYSYDDANRLTNIRFADTSAMTMTYNFRGQKLTETNQRGIRTRWVYDTAGRLTSVTRAEGTPDQATVSYQYNALNERTHVTDARNQTTHTVISYNATTHEQQVVVAAPLSQTTTTIFNAAGQRLRQQDARLHWTQYQYDVRGVTTLTTYADSSTTRQLPDGAGRIVQATDQDSKTSSYGYDAAGRLTSVTNPLNETTSYGYDAANRLTSVTDANGHTTSFGYNARDLRTSQTLPLGQTETTVYDAVGNAEWVTDFNGKTTTYHYDALNRLDTISPDASLNQPSILFTFTPTGQRASMSDGSGTTTSGYDAQDRLTSKATPQGTLSYSYDANGNVLSVRSSNANGVALDYRYDTLNRLDQVTDTRLSPGVTSYGYDPASNLTTTTQPNGVLTTATYNDGDRLTNLTTTKSGTTLTSFAYILRPSGLRTQIVEADGRTSSYSYDDAQRLRSETIANVTPSGSISYSYDHSGNRLSRSSSVASIPSSTSSYDANDRMAGVTYDNNGNILSADGISYSYDYANRITGTSTGVSIGYNGDGVRVSETVAGITTQYLVDENNPTGYAQVVEEIRNGQVQTRYTYGHDLISQTMVGAGATSFYTSDGLGSVRALTNSAGAVTDRYTYDAFGTTLATTGSTTNAYRFTGEQQDAALGMYYLRARYYQPGSGRFWTRDTWALDVQNPREWNRYVYVAADPVNGVDPRGYTLSFSYSAPLRTVALPSAATITKVAILVFATFIVATVSYCAALGDDYILCARTGKDKNDTDTLRWARQEAKRTGQDICTILAAAKAAATDPVEIDAIDYAQKIAKCRNRKKR